MAVAWLVLLIVFAVFALAWHYAADSRDGRDWAARDAGGAGTADMVCSRC